MSRNLGDAPIFVVGAIQGNHGKCIRVCVCACEREKEKEDVYKSMERFWNDGMTEKEEACVEGGEGEKILCERRGGGGGREEAMGVVRGAIWNRHNLQLDQEIEPRPADAKVRREHEPRPRS